MTNDQRIAAMTRQLHEVGAASPRALDHLEAAIAAAATSAAASSALAARDSGADDRHGVVTLTASDRELLSANGCTSTTAALAAKQQIADQKAKRAAGRALVKTLGR